MALEHLPNLAEEDLCLRLDGSLEFNFFLSSSAEEDFALWKRSSKGGSESRETEGDPEQRTPGCARDEVQVDYSGNDVPDGISLLENTAGKTTSLYREVLEGSGGS